MCVSFQFLSFKLSSGCLFSPHHVNQGAVQKPTPQVTLYEPHTAEESLRRRRSGRNRQVLSGHPDQPRELLHVLLPPHERVCVKGHLLHSRVGIQLGLHTVDIDIQSGNLFRFHSVRVSKQSCKQANRLILWGVGAPQKKILDFFLFFIFQKNLKNLI